jgi:hypothetical protein
MHTMKDVADLLQRLNIALPRVRAWIADLLAEHSSRARPVDALGFQRLPEYLAGTVLSGTRAVTVDRIPFPPVAAFGVPEFASLQQMGMAGITFTDMLFVHDSLKMESVYFHELVHAVQWQTLGTDDFLLAYGAGLMTYGYANSPFEVIAFDLQSEFDRGAQIPDLGATIGDHARRTREWTAELFRYHGVVMGA